MKKLYNNVQEVQDKAKELRTSVQQFENTITNGNCKLNDFEFDIEIDEGYALLVRGDNVFIEEWFPDKNGEREFLYYDIDTLEIPKED